MPDSIREPCRKDHGAVKTAATSSFPQWTPYAAQFAYRHFPE